jgi:ribosomal protein S12 methylthiotransferase accessory factor
MEAIELWHAENCTQALIFASCSEVANFGTPVEINRLPHIAGSRYSDHLRFHWIEGFDLVSRKSILVPYEMVHTDYTHPVRPGEGSFPASSNGLASGNHRLEAICHAICEVIERDAIALWSHRPAKERQATLIDPATIDCAVCTDILMMIAQAGLEVALWDATSNIGIATFYCLVSDRAGSRGHIGAGSGTHLDSTIALTRAMMEAVQTRMNYITGSRDDLAFAEFTADGIAEKMRWLETLRAGPEPLHSFKVVPSRSNPTFRADVDWLIDRLTACGIREIACVDLSRGVADIAIVRVVIPGLEAPHDDDAYLPGPRATAILKRSS